tara:strand:- start:110 stop:448 length:339 start_codon:yes stop_codon:yes gene_type:complete
MSSYKLHTFRTDGSVKSDPYKMKPTFKDMYKEIDCTTIQPSTAYLPKYSNRKDGYAEFWMDEESKLKHPFIINKNITDAWYKWAKKTGHQIIPGDFIAGNVCVIQKVQDDAA